MKRSDRIKQWLFVLSLLGGIGVLVGVAGCKADDPPEELSLAGYDPFDSGYYYPPYDAGLPPSDAKADAKPEASAPPPPVDAGVTPTPPVDAAPPSRCPVARAGAAKMVDTGTYCIDSTEVTNAQYGLFVTAAQPLATQPDAFCRERNKSFTPNIDNTSGMQERPWPVAATANLPVTGVDWCDAQAYCSWVGKRLCGRIGGGSLNFGSNDGKGGGKSDGPDDWEDYRKAQWFNACTGGGAYPFPYGAAYNAQACTTNDTTHVACDGPVCTEAANQGQDCSICTPTVGGSVASCAAQSGPYAGVYDLSGNVSEWVDACQQFPGGLNTSCHTMGGHFRSNPDETRCDTFSNWAFKITAGPWLGFRCCGE